MTDSTPSRVPWNHIAIGLAIVVSTFLAASAWERVKTKPPDRSIQVTGSAKKQIVSDQIEWSASIATQDMDRTTAYRNLHGYVQTTLAYLKEQGVKDAEIRVSSATVEERFETEYVGIAEERVERQVFRGYATSETISVRSNDVARVERISREVTQLLERGVPVSSSAPAYFYTRLGELKIEMLAEAARDARNRAENMVKQAGGNARLGKLLGADMGVINVNPVNSTQTSWEGNNDTTSLEKDIITIVHITFELI
jgi:uncharacterized protein